MTDHIRHNDGRNEIATVELTHQETGKVVTLIGVMHVGPRPYWTKINNIIRRREALGDTIHYEMIRKNQRKSKGLNGLKERLFIATVKRMNIESMKAGWFGQKLMIDYKDNWKNHDTDAATSLGSMPLKSAIQGYIIVTVLSPILRMVFEKTPDMLFTLPRELAESDASILHARNELAVSAALAECGNVALIWGAAHLDGMIELLMEEGYVPTGTQWVLHSESDLTTL
jgi:hypothetical protein